MSDDHKYLVFSTVITVLRTKGGVLFILFNYEVKNMLKKVEPLFIVVFMWPIASFAALPAGPGLSGFWQPCDGSTPIEGQYYLTQVDGKMMNEDATLFWYGEQKAQYPDWATVFNGTIYQSQIKSTVAGNWADVPKGQWFRNNGTLELEMDAKDPQKACVLTVTKETGGFGPTTLRKKYVSGCDSRCV